MATLRSSWTGRNAAFVRAMPNKPMPPIDIGSTDKTAINLTNPLGRQCAGSNRQRILLQRINEVKQVGSGDPITWRGQMLRESAYPEAGKCLPGGPRHVSSWRLAREDGIDAQRNDDRRRYRPGGTPEALEATPLLNPCPVNSTKVYLGIVDAPPSTSTFAPVYLRPIVEEAVRTGVDAKALFHGLAFSACDLDVPGFLVSHAEAAELIRRVLRILDNPQLGLELGMRSKITDQGALALGILAAGTLRDAISLALHFPRSAGYLLMISEERSDRHHTMTAEALRGEEDLVAFLVDMTFASMVRVRRQVTAEDQSPSMVELVRKRPANAAAYERFFRSPVLFGCLRNRLVSDLVWIDFALPMANAMSYRLSVQLLEREAEQAGGTSAIGQAVERAIRRAMPMMADLADVAASLNLGVRTLRRRLADEGISYSTLVDAGRRSRALELMVNGRRSIAEVATETGFADARSFRRAFKRWTGVSPSEVAVKD